MAPERKSRRLSSDLRKPTSVDLHVGQRLRLRRVLLGISQDELAARLGLTFQQIQKYERGTNRVSASRLHQLAGLLDVPVSWFFDGIESAPVPRTGEKRRAAPEAEDPFDRRETLELVRIYYEIDDPAVRKKLYAMARVLAGKGEA